MRCPACGKFVKGAVAFLDGDDNIKQVDATCKIHGLIHPDDWEYEDFMTDWDERPGHSPKEER